MDKWFDFFAKMSWGKMLLIIIMFIMLIVSFPFIDSNYLYFLRVNKRIEVLNNISQLDMNAISKNEILMNEYNKILEEIDDFDEEHILSFESVFYQRTSKDLKRMKIATGTAVFFLMFVRNFLVRDTIKNKVFRGILLIIFGCTAGYISYTMPTFRNYLINYLGVPMLELVLLIVIGKVLEKNSIYFWPE